MNKDILVFDLETQTFGKPDPEKDRLKIFACYSYKTNKYYTVTDKEQIQKIINAHKFLVGFNIIQYDNPILIREGIDIKYKINIDLMKIFKTRAQSMKIKKGMLGDLLMEFRLKYICEMLEIVTPEENKLDIDYTIFQKDSWTPEELKEICIYAKRDVEITKKLYEWVEDYFDSFKPFLHQKDVDKKIYLTVSIAKFAYKAICKAMGWEETYGIITGDEGTIKGGYVAYPAGDKFEGDIYCLDFNCFPADTKIRMCTKNGRDGYYYDKNIQNVKPGDKVINQDGVQIVGGINKQWYEGELINIELENGKSVRCTPDHKFPIIRDGKEYIVEVKDLRETDDMITTQTKRGIKNPGFKNAVIKKICSVCGTEFDVFKSQNYINGCSTECSNILRSINSSKSNLGKTKYDTPHLMKMSKERIGKKRSEQIKENISKGTKKGMKKNWEKFINGNKNRDMSFMKTIDWRLKIAQSKSSNIKNGKYRYKDINFRSNWEVILAKNLDKNKIQWKYEPRVFKLDDDTFYLPDFYLPKYDKYIEVKGYMYDHSREKIQKFMEQHDNLILLNDLNKIKDGEVTWLA